MCVCACVQKNQFYDLYLNCKQCPDDSTCLPFSLCLCKTTICDKENLRGERERLRIRMSYQIQNVRKIAYTIMTKAHTERESKALSASTFSNNRRKLHKTLIHLIHLFQFFVVPLIENICSICIFVLESPFHCAFMHLIPYKQ